MNQKVMGLNPVFNINESRGYGRLSHIDSRDITLDIVIKAICSQISYGWKWGNAGDENVHKYLCNVLDSFCDDSEKILQAQEMLKILIKETQLREFLLKGSKRFESHIFEQDFTYLLSCHYIQMATTLKKEFNALKDESKQVLTPFLSYLEELMNEDAFKQIDEFNALFTETIVFEGYIAMNLEYDSAAFKLKKGEYYSSDSRVLDEAKKAMFYVHDVNCKIITADKEINVSDLPFLSYEDGWTKTELDFCSYSWMKEFLNIYDVKELIHEFMPSMLYPLKLTISITTVSDGYAVSIAIDEPPKQGQLELDETYNRSHGNRLRFCEHTPIPGIDRIVERTATQKRLIGKKMEFVMDNYSQVIYKTLTTFFYGSFFKRVQDHMDNFGYYLVELRYLAAMAAIIQRNFGSATDIVFPMLLPKEENSSELIVAKNPTLVLEDPKAVVVPNDITIDASSRVTMITGPNQNGKSRYIDSIALNQIFCQAGWPVFAKQAIMSPKTDLRIHYVHSGVGIKGESRFSHECQRMKYVFEGSKGAYPLIIIDEPYTGTNHDDAKVLLEELLQACADEDITIFLTTHFHALISFIEAMPQGRNLHCHVGEDGAFTYLIKEGASTRTNALDVAAHAGVRYEQLIQIIKNVKNPPPPQPPLAEEESDGLPF